jgi:hypothetical protein
MGRVLESFDIIKRGLHVAPLDQNLLAILG